jgi:hypothetical protein
LKDLARRIVSANESFKTGKFAFKAAEVSTATGNQIDQGWYQEIALRPEGRCRMLRPYSCDPCGIAKKKP